MMTVCFFFFFFLFLFFFFQAEDGIRDYKVTGVQTCALPICQGRIELELFLEKTAEQKHMDILRRLKYNDTRMSSYHKVHLKCIILH